MAGDMELLVVPLARKETSAFTRYSTIRPQSERVMKTSCPILQPRFTQGRRSWSARDWQEAPSVGEPP